MTSIHLTPEEHQALLDHYRRAADPGVRLRAILLLLGAGHPWATIATRTHFRIETSVYGKTP